MSNLPTWNGASHCYSKAYRLLERMAATGAVTRTRTRKGYVCHPSSDMTDIIDALNKGNEEQVKGLLMTIGQYYPAPRKGDAK